MVASWPSACSVNVTVSPGFASPPTVPVMATVPAASVAFTMSSPAMAFTVMVAAASVSMVTSSSADVALLPASSVTVTLKSYVPSVRSALGVNCHVPSTFSSVPSRATPSFSTTMSACATSLSMLPSANVGVLSLVRLSVSLPCASSLPLSLDATRSMVGLLIPVSTS